VSRWVVCKERSHSTGNTSLAPSLLGVCRAGNLSAGINVRRSPGHVSYLSILSCHSDRFSQISSCSEPMTICDEGRATAGLVEFGRIQYQFQRLELSHRLFEFEGTRGPGEDFKGTQKHVGLGELAQWIVQQKKNGSLIYRSIFASDTTDRNIVGSL
jgi:hypothetical protein